MGFFNTATAAFCALTLSTGLALAENHTSDFVEEDAKSVVVDTQVGAKGYVAPTPANLAAAHAPRGAASCLGEGEEPLPNFSDLPPRLRWEPRGSN